MNGLFFVGIVFLTIGGLGIMFVTVPSIQNIVGVAESGVSGETVTNGQVVGVALSGILIWLTTGLFISSLLFGTFTTLIGLAK